MVEKITWFEIDGEEVLLVKVIISNSGKEHIVKTGHGLVNKVIQTENIYQWQIFSIDSGTWVDNTENDTPIVVDGVEHIPVDGKVVIHTEEP